MTETLPVEQTQAQPGLVPYDGPIVRFDEATGDIVLVHGGMSREEVRAGIERLHEHILELTAGDDMDLPLRHEFVDGMYIRRLLIPKGTLIVGKVHKRSCINVVESGDISVLTEFGCARLKPGFTSVSHAGIRKLGFAYEDTVFINVFRTDETDIAKIEDEVACDSYDFMHIEMEK